MLVMMFLSKWVEYYCGFMILLLIWISQLFKRLGRLISILVLLGEEWLAEVRTLNNSTGLFELNVNDSGDEDDEDIKST